MEKNEEFVEEVEMDQEQGVLDNKDIDNTGEDNKDKDLDLLDLLESDERVKQQFQSEVDRMISKAIQTRDKKHQEELKKEKQRANMTAEEIQAEKERELQEKEQQLKSYELQLKKIEFFKENDIDMSLIDYINVEDEDEIEDKTQQLVQVIDSVVEKKVKEKINESGITLDEPQTTPQVSSVDDFKGMTPEEINKIFDSQL